jgi:hypothetical protein
MSAERLGTPDGAATTESVDAELEELFAPIGVEVA